MSFKLDLSKILLCGTELKIQVFEMLQLLENYKVFLYPFPKQALVYMCLLYKSFENTVWKGEIAHDEQFLLFPQCFLTIWRTFFHFHHIWNCHLQTLWTWKSLKFVVWERAMHLKALEKIILKETIASVNSLPHNPDPLKKQLLQPSCFEYDWLFTIQSWLLMTMYKKPFENRAQPSTGETQERHE